MAESGMASATDRLAPLDDVIVLRGVTWADYQRLLEIRGERPAPRLTYVEGVLELMTPSQPRESIKSMIGRLVEAWCLERGVDITPYGSWTLESKEAGRGIEPDECYVLSDNPQPERVTSPSRLSGHAAQSTSWMFTGSWASARCGSGRRDELRCSSLQGSTMRRPSAVGCWEISISTSSSGSSTYGR